MPARVTLLDKPAQVAIKATGKRARDLSALYRGTVDKSVTEFLKDRFNSEGRSGGPPWAPLRPLTVLLRKRPGHGRAGATKIGQDVRNMYASFTKSGAPEGVRVIQPQFYERGSNLPSAGSFNDGFPSFVFGRPTGRRVPARVIFPDPLPGFLLKKWETGLVRHLEGGR